jgi:uncharacterized protein YkvS
MAASSDDDSVSSSGDELFNLVTPCSRHSKKTSAGEVASKPDDMEKKIQASSITSPSSDHPVEKLPDNPIIVTVDVGRESKDTESLFEQWDRTAAADNFLSNHPSFGGAAAQLGGTTRGATIIQYPVFFGAAQTNRDKVMGSDAFKGLVECLKLGLPKLTFNPEEKKRVVVWIISTSLLRFGKDKEQLEKAIFLLENICPCFPVSVMPLDCFKLPLGDVIPLLVEKETEKKRISREVASQRNQGKHVFSTASSLEEEVAVKKRSKEIKAMFKEKNKSLKQYVETALNIVEFKDGGTTKVEVDESGRISGVTIGFTNTQKDFEDKYRKAIRVINAADGDEEREAAVNEQLTNLECCVHSYKGEKKLHVVYCRSSWAKKEKRTGCVFGVPKSQMSKNLADLEYHYGDLKNNDLAIFFDEAGGRRLNCPEYMRYFAALLAGVFHVTISTVPNRIDGRKGPIELHSKACDDKGMHSHFSEAIGKDKNALFDKEVERNCLIRACIKAYNDGIEKLRKTHLPKEASVGVISYFVSKGMSEIGTLRSRTWKKTGGLEQASMYDDLTFDGSESDSDSSHSDSDGDSDSDDDYDNE